jgi:hypothetical protein
MYLLYLDEFGHEGVYDPADPRKQSSPIFGLGGVLVSDEKWKALDRGYLDLKRYFFANEIRNCGDRPERWEFKGNTLSTPSKQSNRRNQRFGIAVLDLLKRCDCTIVGKGFVKRVGTSHDAIATYTSIVQGIMRSAEKIMRQKAGRQKGVCLMVMDRRNEENDRLVVESAQSHLFSNGFQRILESPLVVDSQHYHGVQAADIVCGILGGLLRWRKTPRISSGYSEIEPRYGNRVDTLTMSIDYWRSIWIDQY